MLTGYGNGEYMMGTGGLSRFFLYAPDDHAGSTLGRPALVMYDEHSNLLGDNSWIENLSLLYFGQLLQNPFGPRIENTNQIEGGLGQPGQLFPNLQPYVVHSILIL